MISSVGNRWRNARASSESDPSNREGPYREKRHILRSRRVPDSHNGRRQGRWVCEQFRDVLEKTGHALDALDQRCDRCVSESGEFRPHPVVSGDAMKFVDDVVAAIELDFPLQRDGHTLAGRAGQTDEGLEEKTAIEDGAKWGRHEGRRWAGRGCKHGHCVAAPGPDAQVFQWPDRG